jgi:hypothetical protein
MRLAISSNGTPSKANVRAGEADAHRLSCVVLLAGAGQRGCILPHLCEVDSVQGSAQIGGYSRPPLAA